MFLKSNKTLYTIRKNFYDFLDNCTNIDQCMRIIQNQTLKITFFCFLFPAIFFSMIKINIFIKKFTCQYGNRKEIKI